MSPKRIFKKYFCQLKFTFQTLQTDIFWTLSWPFSCDYSFWLRDVKFCIGIKDLINKPRWKNGKDISNGAPEIKLWNRTKKTHFPVFAKNFRRPWMKLKIFFCQFPNPWTLRVSGMGGYTSKCEQKSKSLHPIKLCIEYHSVCPFVGIGTRPPPPSPASVPLPPEPKGGGGTLACGYGFGGVPI